MKSMTMMLYKGQKSDGSTESAVISFTADRMEENETGDAIHFYNKDGTIGATFITSNDAKLRKVG